MKSPKIIMLEWAEYHTRNESLANLFKAKTIYIGKEWGNSLCAVLSYIPKSIKTIYSIWKIKPDILIITNTQWVLPALCIFLSLVFRMILVLDSHSCAFDGPYIKYPLIFRKLFAKIVKLNFVTNNRHAEIIRGWGGDAIILPDPPIDLSEIKTEKYPLSNKINIVYINVFDADEPYYEVVKAAKNIPNITLYITGDYKKAKSTLIQADHLIYTGYLPIKEYLFIIKNADILISLTTRENTMQCGGNEALSLGKPLIISDTKLLRDHFSKGCVYVKPNARDIRNGILKMLNEKDKHMKAMLDLREERNQEANKKVNEILSFFNKTKTSNK